MAADITHVVSPAAVLNQSAASDLRRSARIGLRTEGLVVLSAIGVLGSFFWLPPLAVFLFSKLGSTRLRLLMALIALIMIVGPVPRMDRIRRSFIWRAWHRYFSTTIVDENGPEGLPQDALLAMVPHGIFPMGQALSLVGWISRYLGPIRPVAATVSLYVPLLRHLLLACGGIPAENDAVRRSLREGGRLFIVPGGIAEMFVPDLDKKEEVVLLASRKGFVRLALETGRDLIPVYIFGNSRVFGLAGISKWLESVSRWLKTSLVFFYGRLGLPIPFRQRLLYAIGRPIRVPKPGVPAPVPQDLIDRVHAEFVCAVRDLYDRYKGAYGWSDRPLVIK